LGYSFRCQAAIVRYNREGGLQLVETVSQWEAGFWEQFETFQSVPVELEFWIPTSQ